MALESLQAIVQAEKELLNKLSTTGVPTDPQEKQKIGLLFLMLVRRRRALCTRLWEELDSSPLKATKKFMHLCRRRPKWNKKVKQRRSVIKERAGPLLDKDFDMYKQTGLLSKEFLRIVDRVKDDVSKPREGAKTSQEHPNSLVVESRVALVISLLRRGQDSSDSICKEYGVSPAYLTREFRHSIPILASRCTFIPPTIDWPKEHPFERVVGAVDCTSHYRVRVHPHQIDYYRGDKKGFFLSAQVVTDLKGQILDVTIFPGRVVDQTAFRNSSIHDQLIKEDKFLLADAGYHYRHLVTPLADAGQEWNNVQKALRSVIEHLNSCTHCFRYASQRIRGHSPELQAFALLVIYQLVACMQRKLRSDAFLNQFPASNCWCAGFATLASLFGDDEFDSLEECNTDGQAECSSDDQVECTTDGQAECSSDDQFVREQRFTMEIDID